MGMDVYGKNAVSEKGQYFRNNVWWWRPLWDYCEQVFPKCQEVSGHYNDGDGFDNENARALGNALLGEIHSGRTAQYAKEYQEGLENLPPETCEMCSGVGICEVQPHWFDYVEGETTFRDPCNGCGGKGSKPNWATHYPFSVENVKEFAEFCLDSGGFEIC